MMRQIGHPSLVRGTTTDDSPTGNYQQEADAFKNPQASQIASGPTTHSGQPRATESYRDTEILILKEQVADMNATIHSLTQTIELVSQGMQQFTTSMNEHTNTIRDVLKVHDNGQTTSTHTREPNGD